MNRTIFLYSKQCVLTMAYKAPHDPGVSLLVDSALLSSWPTPSSTHGILLDVHMATPHFSSSLCSMSPTPTYQPPALSLPPSPGCSFSHSAHHLTYHICYLFMRSVLNPRTPFTRAALLPSQMQEALTVCGINRVNQEVREHRKVCRQV